MSKKLFVGNLPFDVNDADLMTVFSVAGEVVEAKVIINKKTGRSKGYAFIEMATEELAEATIKKFEGATLNERALTVQLATPKQEADTKAAEKTETAESAVEAAAADTAANTTAQAAPSEPATASDSAST